jgi:hypothetical protein
VAVDEPEVPYYKQPDDKIRPGDIFALSPTFVPLRPPFRVLSTSKSKAQGRVTCEIHGDPNGQPIPSDVSSGGKNASFVVDGAFGFAVLLTRGCEIDHGKLRQLAPVLPLSLVQGEPVQAEVIDGKHYSFHYMPTVPAEFGSLFPDSYLDLRRVVTLRADAFSGLARPLSLTRAGVMDLYFSWFRHTTGLTITNELKCPECSAMLPKYSQQTEHFPPPVDY